MFHIELYEVNTAVPFVNSICGCHSVVYYVGDYERISPVTL